MVNRHSLSLKDNLEAIHYHERKKNGPFPRCILGKKFPECRQTGLFYHSKQFLFLSMILVVKKTTFSKNSTRKQKRMYGRKAQFSFFLICTVAFYWKVICWRCWASNQFGTSSNSKWTIRYESWQIWPLKQCSTLINQFCLCRGIYIASSHQLLFKWKMIDTQNFIMWKYGYAKCGYFYMMVYLALIYVQ